MAEDARLVQTLRRITERLRDEIYAGMAGEGFPAVRPAHSAVLRNLPPAGARVVDLAAEAGMTKQSMAYLVSGLEQAGLVTSTADPDDRRARRIRLTARGEAAIAALIRLSRAAEARLAGGLGQDRLDLFKALAVDAHRYLEGGAREG
jgi:DNA-binding MarR family transcriptional regulator